MVTRVHRALDSIFPNGPLIDPTSVHVTYAGPAGLAVWRGEGRPIITTANQMQRFTDLHDTFGRDTLLNIANRPFWNSNDVQRGEIDFHARSGDADGDGSLADTFIFRFADLADVDTKPDWRPGHHGETGVDLWFNGQRIHVNPQANAVVDVFEIRTAADDIHFRWDSGTDARPDGFALLPPCVAVVDPHDINPLG